MPLFFVIDDDGPTRATREALTRRDINLTIQGLGTNGTATCNAVVADAFLTGINRTTKTAQLVAISREGAVAPIHDAPDFRTMAGRLATK
jgi:hypothetical protein